MNYYGPDLFPIALNGLGEPAAPSQFMQADFEAALTNAKVTEVAIIALQAIAAFAALGIFVVQVRALSKRR